MSRTDDEWDQEITKLQRDIIDLNWRNAELVAALEAARPYLEGYADDHFNALIRQIDKVLTANPTPR